MVDREREIEKFKPVEYWSLDADLKKHTSRSGKSSFKASFVGDTGGKKIAINNEKEAAVLEKALQGAGYQVAESYQQENFPGNRRRLSSPSTLQQEAWRKLGFSAKQTMVVAQQLYEGLSIGDEGSIGLITYMRTDSTHVAETAIKETRAYIGEKYGKEYLPGRARTFRKTVKGAQEAHEAIRPTPHPPDSGRNQDRIWILTSSRLYNLIWKRMVASQMAAASYDGISVDIEAAGQGRKISAAGHQVRECTSPVSWPFTPRVRTKTAPRTNRNPPCRPSRRAICLIWSNCYPCSILPSRPPGLRRLL